MSHDANPSLPVFVAHEHRFEGVASVLASLKVGSIVVAAKKGVVAYPALPEPDDRFEATGNSVVLFCFEMPKIVRLIVGPTVGRPARSAMVLHSVGGTVPSFFIVL